MAEGDTLVNALIGAAAVVVAGATLPFGTVVGGGVAGYLQGGTREDGLKVGALAGAIATIPMFLLFALIWTVLVGVLAGAADPGIPFAVGGFGFVALAFAFVFALVYVVGFAALGGWLGNYVKHDTDIDI